MVLSEIMVLSTAPLRGVRPWLCGCGKSSSRPKSMEGAVIVSEKAAQHNTCNGVGLPYCSTAYI